MWSGKPDVENEQNMMILIQGREFYLLFIFIREREIWCQVTNGKFFQNTPLFSFDLHRNGLIEFYY
jgi:hypothetical protein